MEPLTRDEWNSISLPPQRLKDKRLVPPSDLFHFVRPELERRIRAALRAEAAGTTLHLPPSQ
ncbi:hypothetical protein ACFXI8_26585 [Streptomyces niveus]|uniref:hypothetical protein n=1 Tax=Streptomyces niveus TaxID=193462 RepID=UPI0036A5659B